MAIQVAPEPRAELSADERHVLELYRSGRLQPARPAPAWRLILEAAIALRSLLTLAVVLLIVLFALSLSSTVGSLNDRLTGAAQRTGQAITGAGQAVSDAFNPTHPPRYAITQDTEFSSLETVGAGQAFGHSSQYVFTLEGIQRREAGSANPDFAQYATVARRYQVPRETKVLGITIYVDRGEQQYILDRGETFRIGGQLYKVNWISSAQMQMALATYRSPDQFAGRLAFDSD